MGQLDMGTRKGETLNWADGRSADIWRKSRRSHDSGGCWEARLSRGGAHVRDSQNPSGTELGVPLSEWARLLAAVPCSVSPGDR
ncbi:DUF397 domain-containing protein [Nocardiopsis xinjiangensis]|uniref:DUF397 domain-containing protein n=1 Tax=Nocardiopsis xinjiangensis TaxID=124285 RepID=UPI0004773298|nr:DUF397 domain-containing protein [Nocardiopsis xinjiangensis]